MNEEDRDLVIGALSYSIIESRSVCTRECVKATERAERVGIFVTTLRRVLGTRMTRPTVSKWLMENLCNKGIWYDVGELSMDFMRYVQTGSSPFIDVGPRVIKEWVIAAHIQARWADENPLTRAEQDLDALRSSLGSFDLHHQRADRILKEADQLAESLADVLTEGIQ